MATQKKKKSDNKLFAKVKKSAGDLHELKTELAHGKTNVKDKFEELKKKFKSVIQSAKLKLISGEKKLKEVRADFDALQEHLTMGKADTIIAFNRQKHRIMRGIAKLDAHLETVLLKGEVDNEFRHAVEKFKIQMDLLRVHFGEGKIKAIDALEKEKLALTASIDKLKGILDGKKDEKEAASTSKSAKKAKTTKAAKPAHKRHAELKDAYKHIKKTIVKA